MTTRGHIIGRIIDDLNSLSEKIEFRAKLGMFDIHRILENFVRDILKVVYDANDIENLNSTRSNAPGLDLRSSLLKTGYQVSSKVDSGKINSSFEKIEEQYPEIFEAVKFIVIGKKRNSYPSFDSNKVPSSIAFDITRDIIDFRDLSKIVFDLDIEKLLELNSIFDKEFLIVQYNIIEPESETIAPIDLFKPNQFQPALNGLLFFQGEDDNDEELEKINNEGKLLSNLPLRTRLILKYIIENGKEESKAINNQFECRYYLIPKLKREINLPAKEIEEELNILIDERFLGIEQKELDPDLHVPEKAVYTRFGEWFKYLITYSLENKTLERIIINLDLTVIDSEGT
ncbi:hypothetical protein ED312_06620 [Sinomicrobium pectinilyticum]|uniref:SMEK domain-containing protein n=1 Tax=Sinomicrobium pectinilyticum TaxID=1084421 RepID=A0A3N0EQB3_SINP1|nr:SMEK domain-containing protein [Sinomicrobium pectinilyticum]RNL90095.1 hypothetical protein ED312_06620 [Sinomicrobium pectinilyticum]